VSAPPPTPATTECYEAARAWATGAEGSRERLYGLALLVRRGVPAWLAAWETWLPAQAGTATTPATDSTAPPRSGAHDHDHALAVVLATMVEHCRRDRQDREER